MVCTICNRSGNDSEDNDEDSDAYLLQQSDEEFVLQRPFLKYIPDKDGNFRYEVFTDESEKFDKESSNQSSHNNNLLLLCENDQLNYFERSNSNKDGYSADQNIIKINSKLSNQKQEKNNIQQKGSNIPQSNSVFISQTTITSSKRGSQQNGNTSQKPMHRKKRSLSYKQYVTQKSGNNMSNSNTNIRLREKSIPSFSSAMSSLNGFVPLAVQFQGGTGGEQSQNPAISPFVALTGQVTGNVTTSNNIKENGSNSQSPGNSSQQNQYSSINGNSNLSNSNIQSENKIGSFSPYNNGENIPTKIEYGQGFQGQIDTIQEQKDYSKKRISYFLYDQQNNNFYLRRKATTDSKNSSCNSSSAYQKNDMQSSENSRRDIKTWNSNLGKSTLIEVSLFSIVDFDIRRDYVSYFPHNNLPGILGKLIVKNPTLKLNLLNLPYRKGKGSTHSQYSGKHRQSGSNQINLSLISKQANNNINMTFSNQQALEDRSPSPLSSPQKQFTFQLKNYDLNKEEDKIDDGNTSNHKQLNGKI